MIAALCAAEQTAQLRELFSGSEVGEGYVQLGVLHIHIDPDEALLRRQMLACFDGVIEQVADNAAQVQLGERQLHWDENIRYDLNLP